ncbi:MAG: hypothetical protein ACMUIG_09505 [Thermoplasmatota archaeon]
MRYTKPIIGIISILSLSAILVISIPRSSSQSVGAGDSESLFYFDFEDDDASLIHFGVNDPWEWGVINTTNDDNPGPDSAGEGSSMWGTVLNGSYENGTDAYLLFPPVDLSPHLTASLRFLYWADMVYSFPIEADEAGQQFAGDECHIEVSGDNSSWVSVWTYNSTATDDWTGAEIDLTPFIGGFAFTRIHIKDYDDGYTDNGFYIDACRIEAERKQDVLIRMDYCFIPTLIPFDERSFFTAAVSNLGLTVPDDSYVEFLVLDQDQAEVMNRQYPVSDGELTVEKIPWYTLETGIFDVSISLYVGGILEDRCERSVMVVDPFFLDDGSRGFSEWSVSSTGNYSWRAVTPEGDNHAPSSGDLFSFGSSQEGPDGSSGFVGEAFSTMESDWINLTTYLDASLSIYHIYDFSGGGGSCGGIFEVMDSSGSWILVHPEGGYDERLSSSAGEISNKWAFTGSSGWKLSTFDLSDVVGTMTKIRFTAGSGSEGSGRGWMLDDISIVSHGGTSVDVDPPAPIQGFDYSVIDEGEIEIVWYMASEKDFMEYRIYLEEYSYTNVSELSIFDVVTDREVTSMIITGLDPRTRYWVILTAADLSGNEWYEVLPIQIQPTRTGGNSKPVAVITVVGGNEKRKIGEDFIFSASESYDPDDDSLTYKWIMPNQNPRLGENVTWTADVAGNDLVVILEVRDEWGLTDQKQITVDVEGSSSNDPLIGMKTEELVNFGIIMGILAVGIIIIVYLMTVMRKRSRKKLEKRLAAAGIEHDMRFMMIQTPEEDQDRKSESVSIAKVLDLVPVKEAVIESEVIKALPPKPWKGPERMIKVILECPNCGETFRKKVRKSVIDEGSDFEVECPHCRSTGLINP